MNAPAPMGHNNPPESIYDKAVATLDTLHIEATNWLDGEPITNQAQADAVSTLINQIRDAKKDADAARKTEAKPFDDGKKEVQARYKPLLDSADTMADGCKKLLAPFLAKLEAERQAEAQRKREAAARAQREAEEAARAAAATDLAAREAAEMAIQDAKRAEAAARKVETQRVGGKGSGRAITLRTVYTPEIVNMTETARHYWATKRKDVDEFFRDLVAKDVRAGIHNIPGVTVTEEKVAQ